MTRAEQYRAHALDAEKLARCTTDRQAKATLERVARQWRLMADQIDRDPPDDANVLIWRDCAPQACPDGPPANRLMATGWAAFPHHSA